LFHTSREDIFSNPIKETEENTPCNNPSPPATVESGERVESLDFGGLLQNAMMKTNNTQRELPTIGKSLKERGPPQMKKMPSYFDEIIRKSCLGAGSLKINS
jgi:hypothetical protein